MSFSLKSWRNKGESPATPISAEALQDLERRLAEYSETFANGLFGAASVTTSKVANEAIIKEKLSSAVRAEIAGGGGLLGEEAIETKNLQAEAVTQAKIGNASINEEKLTTPVKAKLARVASPPALYGWIGGAAGAGTRALPPTPAELTTGTGTIEVSKGVLFLETGVKYTLQAIQALQVNPAIAFEIGVRRINGFLTGLFGVAAPQMLVTFGKLGAGEAVTTKSVEFEVVTSGWYQVIVVTSESTAASSKTGIGVSVAP